MKQYLSYREVYSESKRGEDYVHPDYKFAWDVTDEEIKRFMTAMNPNFKYFTASGGVEVELIGKDEIEKHIQIFTKKNEIQKLNKDIEKLEN